MDRNQSLSQVWEIVRSVPAGRVASYGAVGAALDPPMSGWSVGRCMAMCDLDDVPWWRIINMRGEFPIDKRSPHLAKEQESRLRDEGVPFLDGRVDPAAFIEL